MKNVYKVRVLTNCNICKNLCIIINWYDPITVILSSWGRSLPSQLTTPATGQRVWLWTRHESHLLQQTLWFLRFLKHKQSSMWNKICIHIKINWCNMDPSFPWINNWAYTNDFIYIKSCFLYSILNLYKIQ